MQTKFRFLLLSVCVMQCCLATAWAGENRGVVAAVQAARAAGVPESELNRMLAAGYRYAVPEKDLAQWIETAGIVAGQGLPATALVDKMEEGLSKKIASGRIGEALGRQAAQLHAAGQLVKAFAGEDKMAPWAITRTADLLAAGLAPEEVRQVLSAAPAVGLDERMEALTFYAVLKQSGLPAEVSQKMVAAGLERRYFKEFPVGLAFTVKTARRQQIADERIAAEAMKVMRGTQTFQQAQRALNLQHSQQPAASQGKGGPSSGGFGPGHGGQGAGHGQAGGAGSGGAGNGNGDGSGGGGSGGGGGGGGGGGAATNAIMPGGVGRTSAAISGMMTTAATMSVWIRMESGSVYHFRLPKVIEE